MSPDGESVYVANVSSDSVSQYDVGAGGALSPKSPATVAAGAFPRGVAVSPDGGSVYVTNFFGDSVSQYDVGAGGALAPKSPATVAAGDRPARGGGEPGRRERLRRQLAATASPSTTSARAGRSRPRARPRWPPASARDGVAVSPDGGSVYVTNGRRRQRLPVRRRRRRGALAEEPGHGCHRPRPLRRGGEPGRRERLRRQRSRRSVFSSTTSARAGRSRPRARPRWPPVPAPRGSR